MDDGARMDHGARTYGIGSKNWPNPVCHPITDFGRLDERLTLRVIMWIYMARVSIQAIEERVSAPVEVLR